jgi:predicted XRE-type DNA-binding protein
MKTGQQFNSVWDAIENDPIRAENLKMRSALLMAISEALTRRDLTQKQAAQILAISQPRVSRLLGGDIESFRLDSLVNFAHRLGLHITLEVAA